MHGCLAADFRNRTLQIPHTGFPGITLDNLTDTIIGDTQLGLLQAMLADLFGNQMILCNHQLLFIRIGTQFNDFHTVQQRTGYCIQGVGSGDKQNIG